MDLTTLKKSDPNQVHAHGTMQSVADQKCVMVRNVDEEDPECGLYSLKVGDVVVASSASNKHLATWAFRAGAIEINHKYDLVKAEST